MLIFAVGIFIRSYHFADWLHFELDQSRDAMVIDLALENGPGELPLLGPKAAGTYLRLGPVFYYFQYVGGLLFGQTPQAMAYPTMFFSILTIPLLYLFLRRIFDEWLSLGLTAISSVSLFLVLYGRFAWNPNAIPFFLLLTFYALLRAVDLNEKYPGRWLVICSAALALATQLHFLVFLSLPVAVAVFLAIKRPSINWKSWLGAAAIFLFLYTPVILNDIKTQGANTKEFFKAITEKSSKGESHTLIDKVVRAYMESARGSMLILTGQEQMEIPSINFSKDNGPSVEFKCAEKCQKNVWLGIIAIVGYSLGIALLVFRFIKEKNAGRKNVLLIVGIWLFLVSGLYVPLAFALSPRFFLLLVPILFVLFGIILESGKVWKNWIIIIAAVIVFLVALNVIAVQTRFSQLAGAIKGKVETTSDRILKENNRVTLEQQLAIADYMENSYKENGAIVYLNSEPFYRRSILYHVGRRGIPYEDLRGAKVYRKGNYFTAYVNNSSADKKVGKYSDNFNVVEKREFGTMIVFKLSPKESSIVAEEQAIKPQKKKKKVHTPGVPDRYTWNEIFN
ncbi:MAG: hypothetical protein UT03_C0034G0004 [Candidatus Moranbacteria bacterium GW2011_GWD2_38_7]|nr:MAG: hypothetical protein UT03_C0034G0004 [Candidatus Moranbacteria bacterium GW2011_GWD2_38_7]